MRGRVLIYREDSATGIISGDDGERYEFGGSDIADGNMRDGLSVDFRIDEDGFPRDIYPLPGAELPADENRRIFAALLAIFLGGFGAHKFYLGRRREGVTMLMIWAFGWVLIGIPTLIISLVGFVEGIIYFVLSRAEFDQRYGVEQRGWF